MLQKIKKKYKSPIFGKTSLNEKQQFKLLKQLNKDDAYVVGISQIDLMFLAHPVGRKILREVGSRLKEMGRLERKIRKC